jgi:type III secretory pathway component EscR
LGAQNIGLLIFYTGSIMSVLVSILLLIIGILMIFGVRVSKPSDTIGYIIVGGYYFLAAIFIIVPLISILIKILK